MAEIQLLVIDPSGLHARPAARFVQAASRFSSRIVIRENGREADAKSLIALLGLTIQSFSALTVNISRLDRGHLQVFIRRGHEYFVSLFHVIAANDSVCLCQTAIARPSCAQKYPT